MPAKCDRCGARSKRSGWAETELMPQQAGAGDPPREHADSPTVNSGHFDEARGMRQSVGINFYVVSVLPCSCNATCLKIMF